MFLSAFRFLGRGREMTVPAKVLRRSRQSCRLQSETNTSFSQNPKEHQFSRPDNDIIGTVYDVTIGKIMR